jgi:flagellar biosynthesis protein FliP
MRAVTFFLGLAVLLLAFITAFWYSEAHKTSARNEQLEREIAQKLRERDREREGVERLRQPLAVQARVKDLAKAAKIDGAKPNKTKGPAPKLKDTGRIQIASASAKRPSRGAAAGDGGIDP